MIKIRLLTFLAGLLVASQGSADPMLSLSPFNGTVTGMSGQTIGWGFTITNPADFLVVTGSQLCGSGSTPPFCNPTMGLLGSYTDFIGPQFIVVGPSPESTTVSQAFDAVAQTGTGSFTIDPLAQAGTSETGLIEISYDLYSVDPNDPSFDPV